MTQPIPILCAAPAQSGTFDTASLEQQSRAVPLAGETGVRYAGPSIAQLVQALLEPRAPARSWEGYARARARAPAAHRCVDRYADGDVATVTGSGQ